MDGMDGGEIKILFMENPTQQNLTKKGQLH